MYVDGKIFKVEYMKWKDRIAIETFKIKKQGWDEMRMEKSGKINNFEDQFIK